MTNIKRGDAIASNKANRVNNKTKESQMNEFNVISKLTDRQVESIQRLFIPSINATTDVSQHLADNFQLDRQIEHNELITLDDGRLICYDDEGYYFIKTNGAKQRLTAEHVKQLIKNQTSKEGSTMKTTTQETKLSYKDWYTQYAYRVDVETIVKEFQLKPDAELYIQPEREYQDKFYPASYIFKFNGQIVAVSDVLTKNNDYNIRSNFTDTALFMIVRTLVNDGQIELGTACRKTESGDRVFNIGFLGGRYDVIINKDGLCTYAGKARPSETEMRNRRLAQLANFRKNINDKRIEEEAKLCNQEYYGIEQQSHYDGTSIYE